MLCLLCALRRPACAYEHPDNGATICDTAKCGKGTCSEVPGIIPLLTSSYKCTCDPGWYQQMLSNLTVLNFAPCIIPDCKSSLLTTTRYTRYMTELN